MIYNLLQKSLQATLLEEDETKEHLTMKIQDGKFVDQEFSYPVNLVDQEYIVYDYSFEYTYTGTITELRMIINDGSLELDLLPNTKELNKIFILLRRCALKPAQSNVIDIPDQYPDLFQYSSNTQVEFAADGPIEEKKKKPVKKEQPKQQAIKKKIKRESEPKERQGTHFDFQEQFITDREQVADKYKEKLKQLSKAVSKDYIVKQLREDDQQDHQVDYHDHQMDQHDDYEIRDFQAVKSERNQILEPVPESKIELIDKAKKRQWSVNHYEKLNMMSKTISKKYVYAYLKTMNMDAEQEKAFTRYILPPDPEDESGRARKKYCLAVVRALME